MVPVTSTAFGADCEHGLPRGATVQSAALFLMVLAWFLAALERYVNLNCPEKMLLEEMLRA